MKLLCYDPYRSAQELAEQKITKMDSLQDLCAESDCISVHTVLNDETRGIIGAEEIARMKPTATLINVSRGPIVDEVALTEAVLSGSIAGVGLDVFGSEPLLQGGHLMSSIMELDNVLLTPHLAFWTSEARDR